MFCDVVGSTALLTSCDAEDLRELIGGCHRAVAETVGRSDCFCRQINGRRRIDLFRISAGARGRCRAGGGGPPSRLL